MRKVQIVRWWLLAILAVALGFIWPECWIFLAFFPGQASCFCCAGPSLCVECNPSSSTPLEFLLEFSGIVDDDCGDCEQCNDSFVVRQTVASCIWEYELDPDICTFTTVRFVVQGALSGARFLASIEGPTAGVQIIDATSFAQSCAMSSFALIPDSRPTDTECDGSAIQCTATAL